MTIGKETGDGRLSLNVSAEPFPGDGACRGMRGCVGTGEVREERARGGTWEEVDDHGFGFRLSVCRSCHYGCRGVGAGVLVGGKTVKVVTPFMSSFAPSFFH